MSLTFKQALKNWTGRTKELKNQIKYLTNRKIKNLTYFELIKIQRDYVYDTENQNNLFTADLLKYANNEKTIKNSFNKLDKMIENKSYSDN